MAIFIDNKFREYCSNGELNFIGIANKYFDSIIIKYGCNETTKNQYSKTYINIIFQYVNKNKSALDYSDDDIKALIDRASEGYAQSTIDRIDLLITRPFEALENDPEIPHMDKYWGSFIKYVNKNATNTYEQIFKKIRKSFTIEEEKKVYDLLCSNPETDKGELIGLAIMFFTGVRNNEAAGLNFIDIKECKEHKNVHYVMVYETTKINSNELKTGGKTPNAVRNLPIIDCLYNLLMKRKEYIISQLINEGMEKEEAEKVVLKMPIACRKNNYKTRCSTIDLSKAGKDFLRFDMNVDEETFAGLSFCRVHGIGTNGIIENDTTTYLLRRNIATHLFTLGFSTLQSQYYMGHNMDNTPLKRSDFNDEEFLYELYILLSNHPLNSNIIPKLNTENSAVLVEKNCAKASIILNSKAYKKYQINVSSKELNNRIAINFKGNINNAIVNESFNEKELKTTTNITSIIKKSYSSNKE